jgi:hypothetical protein
MIVKDRIITDNVNTITVYSDVPLSEVRVGSKNLEEWGFLSDEFKDLDSVTLDFGSLSVKIIRNCVN